MALYSCLRPLLFRLPAEFSHRMGLRGLSLAARLGCLRHTPESSSGFDLCGLHFPNRIGLAAGLDKNADFLPTLDRLGFGAVEVGTVTPKPQQGNVKPRLFRLPKNRALINRMGFNNKGADYVLDKIKQYHMRSVLGVNIGKNKTTPNEEAWLDYAYGLQQFYPVVDYITVNISSPNTPGLRDLQSEKMFACLLDQIKTEQRRLQRAHKKKVPVFIKLAPDFKCEALGAMVKVINQYKPDGLVVSNTTVARDALSCERHNEEPGGLSGQPLFASSTHLLKSLREQCHEDVVMIASGGVMSAEDARDKRRSGADLVQLYTGFIYQGPGLISSCVRAL